MYLWANICSQASTAHKPSFSLTWSDPVPKLSSPHKFIKPASIRFPKNFQPVGVSNKFLIPFYWETLSNAPDVGIDLAIPNNPFLNIAWELAAINATESDGVTKNYLPKIIFLSASPSQAAPKSGASFLF